MSDLFKNYAKRLDRNEAATRQRKIDNAIKTMKKDFKANEGYFHVSCLEPDGIEKTEKDIIVINADYSTHLNPARVNSRFVISHPDTPVKTGSIIYDLYESDWMIISSANLFSLTDRGMIQRVNGVIKMVIDGKIESQAAVIMGVSRRSLGIIRDEFMTLPKDMAMLCLPRNDFTKRITRNMRFMIGNSPYMVSKPDDYTDPDMLYFTVIEDQLGANDNVELGICDYIPVEDKPTPLKPQFVGDDFITYGNKNTYTLINLPANETLLEITVSKGAEYVEETNISMQRKDISFYVKNKKGLIGKEIEIQAKTLKGTVYSKTITITSLI